MASGRFGEESDGTETIDAAKAAFGSQLADLRTALSDQKASASMARAAAKKFETWSNSAGPAWSEAERLAENMLDRFGAWLRSQSPPDVNSETPV